MVTIRYATPMGDMALTSDGTALVEAKFTMEPVVEGQLDEVLTTTIDWLDAYFQGEAPKKLPPLRQEGTLFRQEVWAILSTIPYGQTVTYGDIAHIMEKKRKNHKMSAQAVGNAVGHNPFAILVPCHRVVGAGGKLTGYAAGLEKKQWLLDWEHR